jgi:hypothetical protein
MSSEINGRVSGQTSICLNVFEPDFAADEIAQRGKNLTEQYENLKTG